MSAVASETSFNTIGRISACIGGDTRYSTTIEVRKLGTLCHIRLLSSSPAGGMDSFGTSSVDNAQVLAGWSAKDPVTAAVLINTLKRFFKTADFGTIARYGTPTKKFEWYIDGEMQLGFNVKLAKLALEKSP